MLDDAIHAIRNLAEEARKSTYTEKKHNGATHHINERGATVESFDPPNPYKVDRLRTLSGFRDAVFTVVEQEGEFSAHHILVSASRSEFIAYDEVSGRTQVLAFAEATSQSHRMFLNAYHLSDEFVLKAQCLFDSVLPDGDVNDLGRLLGLAGGFANEESVSVKDDGVTQRVVVRKGIDMENADANNPFRLWARWGFPDVEPQPRDFILRIDEGRFALFELADPTQALRQAEANRAAIGDMPCPVFI